MWQPPYRFLGDERGRSADRVVNIQQQRCLGEARAGFSSLQGRKEAQQDRAGHKELPSLHCSSLGSWSGASSSTA